MSREDWEAFEQLREERKKKRAERRERFVGGPGWTCHHDTHWSYCLLGDRLNYWPGPMRFRWRGKTMIGDVFGFIRKREVTSSPVRANSPTPNPHKCQRSEEN